MTVEPPAVPCPVCATPLLPDTACLKCRPEEARAPEEPAVAPADAVQVLEPLPPEDPEPLPLKPKPEDHFATGPLAPRRPPTGSVLGDFLRFRAMVLPVAIQVAFWVGSLLTVGQGLMIVAASFDPAREPFKALWSLRNADRVPKSERPAPKIDTDDYFSPQLFALGVAVIVLGPLFLRMACEFCIVVFRIYDELKAANDRHQYRARPDS